MWLSLKPWRLFPGMGYPSQWPSRVRCYVFVDLEKSGATMRTELLRFNGAVERDPAIETWMKEHSGELGAIAHQWFLR